MDYCFDMYDSDYNSFDSIESLNDFSCHDSLLFPVYRSLALPSSECSVSYASNYYDIPQPCDGIDDNFAKPQRINRNDSYSYNSMDSHEFSDHNSFGMNMFVEIQDEFDKMISRTGPCCYGSCLSQVNTIVEFHGTIQSLINRIQSFLDENKNIYAHFDKRGLLWTCEVVDRFEIVKFQISLFTSKDDYHIVEFLKMSGSSKPFQKLYSQFKQNDNNGAQSPFLEADINGLDSVPLASCVEKCVEDLMNWFLFDAKEAFKAVAAVALEITDNQIRNDLLTQLSNKLVSSNLVQESILLANLLISSNDHRNSECLHILSPAIARSMINSSETPLIKSLGSSVMSHLIEVY